MLLYIVGTLVAIVAIILIVASTKPDTSVVARSATINAPPDRIFPHVNDFHAWAAWSPWEKLDPKLQRSHTGSPSGVGAKYGWEGNKDVGTGSMEILESIPPSRIHIKLDFLKPFEAHNLTTFTLTPESGGTNVHWKMTGPQPFMMKVMGLFMDMEKMVGKDFEKGLASLKEIAEK